MKIALGQDWNEFLTLLSSKNVRFVLVGGHAVAGHGYGVSFDEAWRGKVEAAFDGGQLFVIGKNELLVNKKASGRAKDIQDVAVLEQTPPPAEK